MGKDRENFSWTVMEETMRIITENKTDVSQPSAETIRYLLYNFNNWWKMRDIRKSDPNSFQDKLWDKVSC